MSSLFTITIPRAIPLADLWTIDTTITDISSERGCVKNERKGTYKSM